MLNPRLKLADWQKKALGFVGGSAILFLIASGEGFLLLCWLQLRQ